MIDKILQIHKTSAQENTELVSLNGRSLDQNLAFDKEAREYTKKVYKKSFEKKKSIDLKNEKRPDDSSTAKAKESSQK